MHDSYDTKIDLYPLVSFYVHASAASLSKLLQFLHTPDLIDQDDWLQLSQRQQKIVSYLQQNQSISYREYVEYISPLAYKANHDFDKLRDLGFIEKKGLGSSTYYILVNIIILQKDTGVLH